MKTKPSRHRKFSFHPSALVSHHPLIFILEICGRANRVSEAKRGEAREQLFVPALGRFQFAVRNPLQVAFHLPDIALRKTPVVRAQLRQIAHAITGDARREIDVRIKVTPRQLTQVAEDGTTPV